MNKTKTYCVPYELCLVNIFDNTYIGLQAHNNSQTAYYNQVNIMASREEIVRNFFSSDICESKYRTYESLTINHKYFVSNITIKETELGWRVAVYFDYGQNFIYLPPRWLKYFQDNKPVMAFINTLALDGEIYFRFKGWDVINGKTQFDFSFKRAADED